MRHRLRRNPAALVGYAVLAVVLVVLVFGRIVAPWDPYDTNTRNRLLPPSGQHWLGTDELGRDILSRILYGLPLQLAVSLGAVAIAAMGGTVLGLVGGYFGGWIDTVVIAVSDLLFAFPAVLLAMAIVAVLEPGLASVTWAIGIAYMPRFVRIVRSSVLKIRGLEYVEAAEALGAGWPRALFGHIFPNATSPLILQATLFLGTSIITAAALDFLGVGAQPPSPSWGAMVNGGRTYLELAPWMVIAPSAAIATLCVGFNLVGEDIRDLLDPKQEARIT